MRKLERVLPKSTLLTNSAALGAASVSTLGLSGCLVVGYSSRGGWFLWPGSLGLLLIVLIIVFFDETPVTTNNKGTRKAHATLKRGIASHDGQRAAFRLGDPIGPSSGGCESSCPRRCFPMQEGR